MNILLMLNALPIEIIEKIADNLDLYSMSQFSATCKQFSFLSTIPRRRLCRAEALRCFKIYGVMRDIVDDLDSGRIDYVDYDSIMDMSEKLGKYNAVSIMTVIMDCYERTPPSHYYRGFDPELYDIIADDMRMGAPPDVCLIWNFYNKVYSIKNFHYI